MITKEIMNCTYLSVSAHKIYCISLIKETHPLKSKRNKCRPKNVKKIVQNGKRDQLGAP